MPTGLYKESIPVPFGLGLDQKSDPFQIPVGKLSALRDAVFNKRGRLDKRYGNERVTALPAGSDAAYVATLQDELAAVGSKVTSYSEAAGLWVDKGSFQPLDVAVTPLVRNTNAQTQCDTAVTSTGLVCTVFTDTTGFYYQVSKASTGATVIAATAIPAGSATVTGNPRVFILGGYFVIAYGATFGGTARIRYFALPLANLSSPTTPTDVTTSYLPSTPGSWDGFVLGNTLYFAWADAASGLRLGGLTSALVLTSTVTIAATPTIMALTGSGSGASPTLYAVYYDGTSVKYLARLATDLSAVVAPTVISTVGSVQNVTACATSTSSCQTLWEIQATYSYDGALKTNRVNTATVTNAAAVGSVTTIMRGIGLASKAFYQNSRVTALMTYAGAYQPTYFAVTTAGLVTAKLAYSNGGGLVTKGLPAATAIGTATYIAYLYADAIQSVNKTQGSTAAQVQLSAGVNMVALNTAATISSVEMAGSLHLSGGVMTQYDGVNLVEHGFHLWPDSVEVTTSGAGGSITAQLYYYVACYEWTDAAGMLHRSAPSLPVAITTSGATSTNTINVPTLRATMKTGVRIVIYRWSAAQQSYYKAGSAANSTTVDSVAITDTQADATILGATLLYTTGGVLENVAAPACKSLVARANRLWAIDAEDGSLWYSKLVVAGVPVEMSDQQTYYVSPTQGAQGPTGLPKTLSPMDDKLVIGKDNAFYYLTGQGPDATGAGNDFSEPIFITATVGCSNQRSIALIPQGLVFESNKGRWLLGRDLSTQYLGASVEDYNSYTATSAWAVPGTNQVRITLDGGPTLVYDYFFDQWGTFTPPGAGTLVSGCLQGGRHTVLTQSFTTTRPDGTSTTTAGEIYRELSGSYLDGSRPVTMALTTAWLNFAGLQGLQRIYQFFLIGSYISPHLLDISIAYDYNTTAQQTITVSPDNYAGTYGSDSLYGGSAVYGGADTLEQWEIYNDQQKLEAMQLTITERYDATQGGAAGAGLTLSGLLFVAGLKRKYPNLPASRSAG